MFLYFLLSFLNIYYYYESNLDFTDLNEFTFNVSKDPIYNLIYVEIYFNSLSINIDIYYLTSYFCT